MLQHALMEGEILFVRSANGNGNGIPLNGIPFQFVSVKKFSKVLFPFVSVKTNFESSVKIPFPLIAQCFCVNPYHTPAGSETTGPATCKTRCNKTFGPAIAKKLRVAAHTTAG